MAENENKNENENKVTDVVDSEVTNETSQQQEEEKMKEEVIPGVVITVVTPYDEKICLGVVSLMENGSFLRQSVAEYYESCFYSKYDMEYLKENGEKVIINDFVELINYIAIEEAEDVNNLQEVTLRMILADYDEKAILAHVKRFRDILVFPPQSKASTAAKDMEKSNGPETNENGNSVESTKSENEIAVKKERAKTNLPEVGTFLDFNISLQEFYDIVLYSMAGDCDGSNNISLNESILNISYSGWNPPPFSRATAGDLCYFEVRTAANSVVHITAMNGGFYVNNSTLNNFDPSPASNAHFSHELLHTIMGINEDFKLQWEAVGLKLEPSDKNPIISDTPADALQSIAALFQQGQGDFTFQYPQWYAEGSSGGSKGQKRSFESKHKYDASRAQNVLADSFGMEEKGVPREWNEEIQSIRSLPAKDTSEQIMKSRFIYRTSSEFAEACRQSVIAICKGHISPVNPMDAEENHVYIYNNIFFSRSIDSKEAFKVCSGDEASRKAAVQDYRNQKLLHSLGIEGLSSVLCTIVDFMGQRFVGQSIIPGILQQANGSSARLMYGSLEDGVRLKCKKDAFKMMQKIGEKLHLAERNILANPTLHESDFSSPITNDSVIPTPDSMLGFLNGAEGQQSTSIRMDDDDETCPIDSKTITHIGPVEGKLLQGSDDRLYILEVNRLTPLDANFIEKEKGGTGNVIDWTPDDENIRLTYCLRHELIQEYNNTATMTLRQNELQALLSKMQLDVKGTDEEFLERESKETKTDVEKDVIESNDSVEKDQTVANSSKEENVHEKPDDIVDKENNITVSSKEEMMDNEAHVDFSTEELGRITRLESSLVFNPNCFLGDKITCKENDDDVKDLEKDEDLARDLANFLWTKSLPNLHTMIRIGKYSVQDGKGLTDLMHARGVNMRYLGQLAVLADAAEVGDKKVYAEGKFLRNPMPLHWLDLLVMEMLSRSMKHLLGSIFRSNKAVCAAPAKTIATFLNYLLSETSLTDIEVDVSKKDSTGSKKKNRKLAIKNKSHCSKSVSNIPESYNALLNREQFWLELLKIARSKFLYNGLLTNGNHLSPRIFRLSLLRRICQTCGFRVLCKDYDFADAAPFCPSDIQEVYPIVKNCEPLVIFTAGHNLLQAAHAHLQNANLGLAFELAQQGAKWMGQITGPAHATTLQALHVLSSVLMANGDNEAAISTLSKKLTLDAQLFGLDSNEVMQGHILLGSLYHEVNNYEAAIVHLRTALYVLRLMAGSAQPEIANIYYRLAVIYHELGDYAEALPLLESAEMLIAACGAFEKSAPIYQMMSNVHVAMRNYKDAIYRQKQCYVVYSELFGEEDKRTIQAKSNFANLIRENADYNAQQSQEKADRERSEKVNNATSLWLEHDSKKKKKSGSKKKSASKKKGKVTQSLEEQDW